MTDEERIKATLEPKKESILKAFRNKATYEKWDKHSPIWAYYTVTGNVEKITDAKIIEAVLKSKWLRSYVSCFLNKEDLDTYKWLHDFIETEVDDAIMKGFESSINNLVDIKDLNIGDKNIYYTSDYYRKFKEKQNE